MRQMKKRQRDIVDDILFCFTVHDNGDVLLTWEFVREEMGVPLSSDDYRVMIPKAELTTWRHVIDFVEETLRTRGSSDSTPMFNGSYFIYRLRRNLSKLFFRDRDREISNFLGIARAEPEANSIPPDWIGIIDLMEKEEKAIPVNFNGNIIGDLTAYTFGWTVDGTLWFMWCLTDSDGTRSMPHWSRHIVPKAWLNDGWEAFLDRMTETFRGVAQVYTRSMLARREDLRAFLGL